MVQFQYCGNNQSHNLMDRLLLSSSTHPAPSNTATFLPEAHPQPSESLKVPKINNVGTQSDWNTQDKPPKLHRALSKDVDVHTKQAGAKAKRNEEGREQS